MRGAAKRRSNLTYSELNQRLPRPADAGLAMTVYFMKKYFKKIKILVSSAVALLIPYFVLASPAYDNLKTVGSGDGNAPYLPIADAGTNSLAGIVGIVIQAFLGLLGVIFLSYLLYAGYAWMTAQGDEEKVTKAKDTIQRAIIGIIVTIGAYAISYFVLDKLVFKGGILQ